MNPEPSGLAYEREVVNAPRYAADELPEFLTMRIAKDMKDVSTWGPCDCEVEGFPLEHGLKCPVRQEACLNGALRIVQRHARVRFGTTRCHCCWTHPYDNAPAYPCDTLLALAQSYAEHPDFRAEWLS